MTVARWSRQLEVNLTGTFLAARASLEDLLEAKGSIVVVSSVHAVMSLPGFATYAASKGGLSPSAVNSGVEYGPSVRVNTVVPGPIDMSIRHPMDRHERVHPSGAPV